MTVWSRTKAMILHSIKCTYSCIHCNLKKQPSPLPTHTHKHTHPPTVHMHTHTIASHWEHCSYLLVVDLVGRVCWSWFFSLSVCVMLLFYPFFFLSQFIYFCCYWENCFNLIYFFGGWFCVCVLKVCPLFTWGPSVTCLLYPSTYPSVFLRVHQYKQPSFPPSFVMTQPSWLTGH